MRKLIIKKECENSNITINTLKMGRVSIDTDKLNPEEFHNYKAMGFTCFTSVCELCEQEECICVDAQDEIKPITKNGKSKFQERLKEMQKGVEETNTKNNKTK